MKTKEERIHARDDALLKKEASMRRSRIGAIVFAILFLLTATVLSRDNLTHDKEIFWSLSLIVIIELAYYYDLRIKHIESIKMYRKKLGEQTVFSRNTDHQLKVYWDCPKCAEKNIPGDKTCRKCGFQTKSETESQPANSGYRPPVAGSA
jgi:predicted RNA-binding Zn-ribbon protein involved in translation (DUF1610 family)